MVAHVAQKKPEKGYYEIPSRGLEVVHLRQGRNELEHLLQLPFNFLVARKKIDEMDILHCRMPDYTGMIGVLLGKIYSKDYFIQTIADWYIEAKKTSVLKKCGLGFLLKMHYYLYEILERVCCKDQLVFAQGTSSYRKYKKNPNAHLISSAAHYEKDIGTIKRRFKSSSRISVLHVGRLTGIKNQKLLINLIYRLNQNPEVKWHLTILGEGPLRSALQNEVELLKQTSFIKLVGQVDRGDELWSYFDRADVFVMASKSEGTPKVILEAMARSVPVVAPNVGGIPFLVKNNERGLLYEEGNLDNFLQAIQSLKNEKEGREKMIDRAYEFSRNNTVERCTQFMLEEVSAYFSWKKE